MSEGYEEIGRPTDLVRDLDRIEVEYQTNKKLYFYADIFFTLLFLGLLFGLFYFFVSFLVNTTKTKEVSSEQIVEVNSITFINSTSREDRQVIITDKQKNYWIYYLDATVFKCDIDDIKTNKKYKFNLLKKYDKTILKSIEKVE